jgi:hypothetical protein
MCCFGLTSLTFGSGGIHWLFDELGRKVFAVRGKLDFRSLDDDGMGGGG